MEKKFNVSSKQFAADTKGAKVELNGIFKNPFVVCNLLNKAAKGDFEKVANVNGLTHENFAKVAKELKKAHGGRYAFEFDYLLSDNTLYQKDSKGRFCSVSVSKHVPEFQYDMLNIVPAKNKVAAKFIYLKPVTCSINSIFNAFAKVAKVEIKATEKATEKAEKAAKKAAKDSEKAFAAAKKGAIKDYNAGKLTEIELADKLAEIKAKFGK